MGLHQKAGEAFQRLWGSEHPDSLAAMNNLGHTLKAMGERTQAREVQPHE
ncbi:tetratricopeptide repeat protein [Corallococcus sp. AB032C]|nr:tetratricopeptide repeat protein [Corallococcus sp. AB032C]